MAHGVTRNVCGGLPARRGERRCAAVVRPARCSRQPPSAAAMTQFKAHVPTMQHAACPPGPRPHPTPPSPNPPQPTLCPPAPLAAANEDCCLYTYDMRRMASASCVHQDFVSAVMDVDYSPTGREFVAGSYDRSGGFVACCQYRMQRWDRTASLPACSPSRPATGRGLGSAAAGRARRQCCRRPKTQRCVTPPCRPAVRIFSLNGGHSRDVYHTKRMQRVFAVRFSGDGSYVFSGGCSAGPPAHRPSSLCYDAPGCGPC